VFDSAKNHLLVRFAMAGRAMMALVFMATCVQAMLNLAVALVSMWRIIVDQWLNIRSDVDQKDGADPADNQDGGGEHEAEDGKQEALPNNEDLPDDFPWEDSRRTVTMFVSSGGPKHGRLCLHFSRVCSGMRNPRELRVPIPMYPGERQALCLKCTTLAQREGRDMALGRDLSL